MSCQLGSKIILVGKMVLDMARYGISLFSIYRSGRFKHLRFQIFLVGTHLYLICKSHTNILFHSNDSILLSQKLHTVLSNNE